ncbi:MAG: hypothetical protein FWH36_00035 [Lentimicrobiaceae bacterium]|nr:hypothetical protein [Lentimicrobiaceae bacterium]
MKKSELSIGENIKKVFDKRNMSISEFAKLLCYERTNPYNIFLRKKIDIDTLCNISVILNHNFVEDVCTKHEHFKEMFVPKISVTLEINTIDAETLKTLLNTLQKLEITTIRKKP